jgi:small subunit ribosomal protein S18
LEPQGFSEDKESLWLTTIRKYQHHRHGHTAAEGGGGRKFFRRKKVCKFCVEKIDDINYKDVRLLGQFVAERGKIVPRRLTGVCTPHQRRLTSAIKRARNIALLPFAAR